MDIIIRQPETADEWEQYFHLRWQLLRSPWQQPIGSEKDELEAQSVHRCAMIDKQIVAVGRLHHLNPNEAQIRYMAVANEFQGKGIGQSVLHSLESAALEKNTQLISLNARENALPFYEKNNYVLLKESHTLYGKIKHFKMQKTLSTA